MPAKTTLFQGPEQPDVGDAFTTPGRTVTEADVVSFVEQTGEMHPLHSDADWSTGSQFGERIVPGMLTLACTAGLLQLSPERAIALLGLTDVVFTRPVKIGDTLSVSAKVTSVTPGSDDTKTVVFTLFTLNQHEKLVCRSRLRIKWKN